MAILQLGLLAVSRYRRWWVLSALTTLGGLIWVALWLAANYRPEHSVWLGAFLLLSCAASIAATIPRPDMPAGTQQAVRLIAVLGSVLSTGMLAALVGVGGFSTLDWCFLGLLSAGVLVLSRISPRYEALPWFALLAVLAMLAMWTADVKRFDSVRFGWTLTLFGIGFVLGGYACLFGSPRPVNHASFTLLAGVAALLVGYWGFDYQPALLAWGWICLICAGGYALMAAPPAVRRTHDEDALPLALLLTGMTALVSLAMPIELERRWIGVAWALEVPALAWIIAWLRVPQLRPVAAALSILAGVSLLPPAAFAFPIGAGLVLNWLTYGYGLTAMAFGVAAWRFEQHGDRPLMLGHQIGCVVMVVLLVVFNLQHGFHPGERLVGGEVRLIEAATYVVAELLLAIAALLIMRGAWTQTLRYTAAVLGVLALAWAGGWLVLWLNPIMNRERVGERLILNWLLYAYGGPALLFGVAATCCQKRNDPPLMLAHQIGCVVMGVVLVLLTIRHGFQPDRMELAEPTLREAATYIIATLGLALAALPLMRGAWVQTLRFASAALGSLSAIAAIIFLGFGLNPLWSNEPVGERVILNWLLYAYAAPALLLGALCVLRGSREPPQYGGVLGVVAIVVVFVLVSLEVRQWFHGSQLAGGGLSAAERYSYSAAWVALGIALLSSGILTGSLMLRWASLAVMLLSVCKVFLYDTAALRDLYRVFSLLGLGLSLMLLGFLYQRVVFRARPA
ncbi:hypothetical protein RAS1_31240 [Phycisphaerae bacterium RAS1]|nr:hypothetical protein RAS1_31240 [Phycisphaerae bacterium RAS1]